MPVKLSHLRFVASKRDALVRVTRTDELTWSFTDIPTILTTDVIFPARQRLDGSWFIVSQRVRQEASAPAADEVPPAATAVAPPPAEHVPESTDLLEESPCLHRGCVLYGSSGANVVSGGPYTDVLAGGAGDDTLTGDYGTDLFAFVTRRSSVGSPDVPRFGPLTITNCPGSFRDLGIDTLSDFTHGIDRIGLERASFAVLASALALSTAEFAVFPSDLDAVAGLGPSVINYSPASGVLYYDANGTLPGLGDGGPFAILANTPVVSHSDFVLLRENWDDTPSRWEVPPVSSN